MNRKKWENPINLVFYNFGSISNNAIVNYLMNIFDVASTYFTIPYGKKDF